MLGMLHLGARSGYAIKKTVDVSTKHFWPTSLAQVYPELARLQQAGLVTRREDPRGARSRSAYELTDEGQAALLAWLRSTHQVPAQGRDEGMLRLFFADALPHDDQLALIRRLRERDREGANWIQTEIMPLANAAAQRTGRRFPGIVARLSADMFDYADDWLAKLQSELEAERPEENHPATQEARRQA
jgi:DNA-binding PadR family transcriptional regulator